MKARGGVSISSLGGQVLNPYDLTLTPGGSSGGTAASLASNFAVLGTAEVNKVMEQAIKTMEAKGATVVRFSLPEYDAIAPNLATDRYEARTAMEQYFAELPADAPVKNFRQLVDSKSASPDIQKTMEAEIAIDDGLNNQAYKDRTLARDKLRLAVASKMADLQLDAILYTPPLR